MTDKQQQWDRILGDKLRQVAPDYRAESWDALADRLGEEETDAVTSADAAIATAIDKIEPRFSAASWDMLSARLDAEEAAFDAGVAAAVQQIQPVYRSGSWAALAARLELEAHRRISIWQTKSLELMTAFVLLLAFWVFFPYFQSEPSETPAGSNLAFAKVESLPAAADNFTSSADGVDRATGEEQPTLPQRESTASLPSKRQDQPVKESTAGSVLYVSSDSGEKILSSKVLRTARVDQLRSEGIPALPLADINKKLPEQRTVDTEAVALLAVSNVTPFDLESADPEFSRKLRRTRSPLVQTWGIIGTHWDQNVVFTPSFTLERTFPSTTRLSRGRTIGATYSIGRGRHRWESGVLYRMKQYFPSYVVRNDERERSVNRMRYHSFSIPLSYQHALFRLNRWSAYVNVGASFNMTLAAHIDIEDIYLNSLSNPAIPRSEEARRTENFGEHNGLLQGGKFSNNATLYTLLGAGLEYRWPAGLSLFVQPTVTRRIIDFGQDGEGPLLERINSNSVLFGFKREF